MRATSASIFLSALLVSSTLAAPVFTSESGLEARGGKGEIVSKVVKHVEEHAKHYKAVASVAGGVHNSFQNGRRSLDDVEDASEDMYARDFDDEAELDQRNILLNIAKKAFTHKKSVGKGAANGASGSQNSGSQRRSLDLDDSEDSVVRSVAEDDLEWDVSARDVGMEEDGMWIARSVGEDELSWDVSARDVGMEEEDGMWIARSVGEDELSWDVEARDVLDGGEESELEDRSKAGKKIGGFFKSIF